MTDRSKEREAAFDRIVHEYYEAIESGNPIEPDRFVAEHPDFANELKSFFADVEVLDEVSGFGEPCRTIELDAARVFDGSKRVAKPGDSLTYIGEYRILEEIARGGMGVVFKARQEKLRRTVALKMILSGRFAAETEVDRFRREARAAAALRHPNIVGVYEIGVHEGNHYFTMAYIESVSLSHRLREGSFAPRDAAILLEILARATDYAHRQGVLHRDLKPANVLIDSSAQPHIADFGLAKPIADVGDESEMEITRTGQIVGTPSYMAPEQAAAKHQLVSVASDVYSLGAILYACLSGRAPFVAESTVETLRQVINDDPLPTRLLNPRVPKDLETICLKCLSKEPHHRYPTAEELADDLRRFLEGRPVVARPVSLLAKSWRFAKRNPWPSLATALLILIAVVSPVVAIQQHQLSRELALQAGRILEQKNEIGGLLTGKEQALDRAIAAEQEATESAASSRAQLLHNRRLLYISDMQRMADLYEDADIRAMREMLARHKPNPKYPDLRDFEWYYWSGKCDAHSVSWKHDEPVDVVDVSPDGRWVASCSFSGDDTAFQVRDASSGRLETAFRLAGLHVSSFGMRNDREMIVAARGQREVVLLVDWTAGEIAKELHSYPTNPKIPASRFAFSGSAGLVARAFLGDVRCYDSSTGQSLRIRLPQDADITQYRKQGVVYRDNEGRYIDFIGHVRGATQTRFGNSVVQTDPTNGVARSWKLRNALSPASEPNGGPVMSLGFSSSEELIAAGSRGGRIKVWKRSSNEELLDFDAHDGIIWDLAFSSDDQRLASAGDDGLIRVWDLSNGAMLFELVGHTGAVKRIDFGTDGFLASGGMDRLTRVWQLPSKHPVATFRGNEGPLTDVRLSSDARFCWTAGADHRVRMWDVAGDSATIVVADPAPFDRVDMSDDERLVVASGLRAGVSVWNLRSGRRRFLATPSGAVHYPICHVRVQGDSVCALRWDGALFRWDLATGQRELLKKYSVQLLSGMPQAAIAPDGSRIAVQQKDGSVLVESASEAGPSSVVLGNRFPLAVLKFSADGKQLLTNVPAAALQKDTDQVALQLWDAESGRLIADVARGSVLHAEQSMNGRVAYVNFGTTETNRDRVEELVIWDQMEQQEVARHTLRGVKELAISPDGTLLAIVLGGDDDGSTQPRISVRRADDGTELHGLAIPCRDLAFTPDGSQLLVTGIHGRIDLLDTGTGRFQRGLVNPAGGISSVAYAPHEPSIAATFTNRSSSGRSIISLDSSGTQKSSFVPNLIRRPEDHSAVYLPDGALTYRGLSWQRVDLSPELKSRHRIGKRTSYLPEAIARSANACFFLAPDRTLFRCDFTNAKKVSRSGNPVPATGACGAIATTTDGRLIALAFAGEIRIYDGIDLSPLHVIEGILSSVRALAFSSDGSLLALGATDGSVKLWKTGGWAAQATIFAHSKPITSVCFSSQGQSIVSASEDGTIVLSDVVTGLPKTTFDDHDGPVHWIEFSPSGRELASAGEDGTIRRWQIAGATE